MVQHWPITVCKVSLSASTGPFDPVRLAKGRFTSMCPLGHKFVVRKLMANPVPLEVTRPHVSVRFWCLTCWG